jgi:hypothetical protein
MTSFCRCQKERKKAYFLFFRFSASQRRKETLFNAGRVRALNSALLFLLPQAFNSFPLKVKPNLHSVTAVAVG